MQPTKKLTSVLRDLIALLEAESSRNPAFAKSLDEVLAGLPSRSGKPFKIAKSLPPAPDVFAALQERGETEFRFWVRELDVPALKSIIKANGFDPAKVSQRWADKDKYVALVADQTVARARRGSAFLSPKSGL